MKKIKIAPAANVVTVETLKSKFDRLAAAVGENGLTPNFSYALIQGAYGIKSGVNPQTNKPVEYATVKSVRIGQKSAKISGLSELSINSLKRTVNVDEQTVDVIDFSAILPNCSELNSLQILESLDESKMFAIVPNGTVLANTNFDTTVRPRQLYKCIEISDEKTVNNVLDAAITAGLIEEETETETAEKAEKPKK